MVRHTKWWGYRLVKGSRWAKCSACHHKQSGCALVERTGTDYRGRTVKQFLCWHCTNSPEGAALFVQAFPNSLEKYTYGPWTRLRPTKVLELFTNPVMPGAEITSGKHMIRIESREGAK